MRFVKGWKGGPGRPKGRVVGTRYRQRDATRPPQALFITKVSEFLEEGPALNPLLDQIFKDPIPPVEPE